MMLKDYLTMCSAPPGRLHNPEARQQIETARHGGSHRAHCRCSTCARAVVLRTKLRTCLEMDGSAAEVEAAGRRFKYTTLPALGSWRRAPAGGRTAAADAGDYDAPVVTASRRAALLVQCRAKEAAERRSASPEPLPVGQ